MPTNNEISKTGRQYADYTASGLDTVSPLSCEAKVRLLTAYHDTTAEYAAAVGEMTRFHISAELLERLRGIAEEARKASEAARLKLDRHITEHGC